MEKTQHLASCPSSRRGSAAAGKPNLVPALAGGSPRSDSLTPTSTASEHRRSASVPSPEASGTFYSAAKASVESSSRTRLLTPPPSVPGSLCLISRERVDSSGQLVASAQVERRPHHSARRQSGLSIISPPNTPAAEDARNTPPPRLSATKLAIAPPPPVRPPRARSARAATATARARGSMTSPRLAGSTAAPTASSAATMLVSATSTTSSNTVTTTTITGHSDPFLLTEEKEVALAEAAAKASMNKSKSGAEKPSLMPFLLGRASRSGSSNATFHVGSHSNTITTSHCGTSAVSSSGNGAVALAVVQRNEPFEEVRPNTHMPLTPTSSSSSSSQQGSAARITSLLVKNAAAPAPAATGGASNGAGANSAHKGVRKSPLGSFYFYTKPRLGRFTALIDHLLGRCEKGELDIPIGQFPSPERRRYRELFALSNLIALCDEASRILSHEPTLLPIKVNILREEMVVVGDIHGQFNDLYRSVLSEQYNYQTKNPEKKDKMFLFLGDFVDRGPHSLETILLVLALKVEYPHLVYAIRGNHEEKTTSRVYGFLAETQVKLGKDEGAAVWEIITSTFATLPLAALVTVENRLSSESSFSFFATHGGLSPQLVESLGCLKDIKRESYGICREKTALSFVPPGPRENVSGHKYLTQREEEICKGLMWSDPTTDAALFSRNPRGCGFLFGPAASQTFCEKNAVDFIVRAHQVVMGGYLWKHKDRVLTIFSAPNYCGVNGNLGAVMILCNAEAKRKGAAKADEGGASSSSSSTTTRFSNFMAFVQYEAAEDLEDDEVPARPNMNFPYASCFT